MKKLCAILILLSMLLLFCGCEEPSKSFINGVNLEEYSIVYSESDLDYAKRAAEYIKAEILERTGLDLPIVKDTEAESEYEIVVGDTSRAISDRLDAETEGLEFSMLTEEGKIALEGDYFIIAAAAYYFIENYVPYDDFDANIPLGEQVHEPIVKEAKNFILLIGDGMGVHQTEMFDYIDNTVEYGDGEDLFYGNLLPYKGFSRTNSLTGVTDSAAAGTAMACGVKTYNETIGQDGNGNDAMNLTELANSLGKANGVMSTEASTGATPSTFSAHTSNRDNSSEIIDDQFNATLNYGTIIECGYDHYSSRYMKMIETTITDTLAKLDDDSDGFFLMYEEAYIDKHCDDMDMARSFDAMVRFNQAIARFMEYTFYNPETFLLITADHETGGLHPEDGKLVFSTTDHTDANVPIFAYGDGAELFGGKEIENIQIAHTIAALMGNDSFGDQSVYQSLTK